LSPNGIPTGSGGRICASSVTQAEQTTSPKHTHDVLAPHLGGHKPEQIGKTVGLQKASVNLLMKKRVAKEKQLVRRVWRIEESLTKSKKQTDPFGIRPWARPNR
jgi:hypothetical protein